MASVTMVWDCAYCGCVNPNSRYGELVNRCEGCGAIRKREDERSLDEVGVAMIQRRNWVDEDVSPYYLEGGVSIRETPIVHTVWL